MSAGTVIRGCVLTLATAAAIALVALCVRASLSPAHGATATTHPRNYDELAKSVWIYLPRADEPTLVARAMIHHPAKYGRASCVAQLTGYSRRVWVEPQDFPYWCAR